MLIDDNKIDLFISQKKIEKVQYNSNIKKFIDPKAALKYLKNIDGNCLYEKMFVPDIIFLDINMPEMNGFEFLNEFNKLININKKRIHTYILSSSTNGEDIHNAKKQGSCTDFLIKPLTSQSIKNVLSEFNPNIYEYETENLSATRSKTF